MTDTRCECCDRINKVDDVFSPSEVAIAVDDAIDLAGTVCLKLDGVSQHYPNTLPILQSSTVTIGCGCSRGLLQFKASIAAGLSKSK